MSFWSKMKGRVLLEVLRFIGAVISAAITALTTTSCLGKGPLW